ncbi:MAG: arcadin 1 [Nitrososphaerota archaeon]|nr:arcadin 1 [Nitrososphaerota archaeon]MDG7052207.1 arcadin 1 [Nitrososphaerota archaeon]
MLLVKVNRISSMNNPTTGIPGRQVELTEFRRAGIANTQGAMDDVLHNVMYQFQSLGILQMIKDVQPPKIVLFLTDDEYIQLGINFEVNDIYELTLETGAIKFVRSTVES